MTHINIHHGDCLDWLATLPKHSLDSCVTDPPYHMTSVSRRFKPGAAEVNTGGVEEAGVWARKARGFMGQEWDGGDIAFRVETWTAVYRALKPGAHLLAFGSSRSYHRMACAIEDAGFEIRDSIDWVYATGFPKSLDVSKGIDATLGAERQVIGSVRTNVGIQGGKFSSGSRSGEVDVTAPASEEAIQWSGWGTALKPAKEPIILARVPIQESSIARQVLATGTGAINVDGCRVAGDGGSFRVNEASQDRRYTESGSTNFAATPGPRGGDPSGRHPPNVILSHGVTLNGHDACADGCLEGCPARELGEASRFFPTFRFQAKPPKSERERGCSGLAKRKRSRVNSGGLENDPKWAPVERGNDHATVKPLGLMRWLVRLVTPPGGTVLEPFLGSGTTGMACVLEGLGLEGCDKVERHVEIARARIQWTQEHGDVDEVEPDLIPGQGTLFGEAP